MRCQGDVDETQMLGDLKGKARIIADFPAANLPAVKDISCRIVPGRHVGHPVAYVMGRIFEGLASLRMIRTQAQVSRQEQQKGLRAVMRLGRPLIAVITVRSHPREQIRQQGLETFDDGSVARNQIVRKPGQGVVRLILPTVIAVRTIHETALLEPPTQIGAQ